MTDLRSRVVAWVRQLMSQVARWCAQQRRSPADSLLTALGVVAAGAGVVLLLVFVRDDVRRFDSLPDMYEPLAAVGLDCAPPRPVLADPDTGGERVFCSAADGSLAVLELSDSYADAEQAVVAAHAGSEQIVRYAQLARQVPVAPKPVLLGGNWTLVGDQAVLDRVKAEYGGTIYPYPEAP